MDVSVGSRIRIDNPSEGLKRWCKENLEIPNPDYAKKVRMNLWLGNTPQIIQLYEVHGNTIYLPFGCLRAIKDFQYESVISDFQSPTICTKEWDVALYDYQETAVEKLLQAKYGILQSPAGSGKTQIGISLACKLRTKTLWLTHTKDLLTQSYDRAAKYVDKSLLGRITEGKVEIGQFMTFATIQTMCNVDLLLYQREWDCIIVDECHRVAGTPTAVSMFSKVLNALIARHKYGLSATVHRADGMIKATYALLGNIVYQVPPEAVSSRVMQVITVVRDTKLPISTGYGNSDGTLNYAKLINYITESPTRNNMIIEDMARNREHYNLILSARLEHLHYLYDHLPPRLQAEAVIIDGSMTSKKKKAEREQAIEDMRLGKKRYLFATYSLAKEGLDIPRLDRLYLTTPQKDYAVIVQSIGRIARVFEDKEQPIAYDYVDSGIRFLHNSFRKRCTSYRKCGCTVVEERYD